MGADNKDIAGVAIFPPLAYLIPLVAGLLLHWLRPLSPLPRSLARLLGLPLTIGGIMLNLAARRTMQRAETPLDPRQPTAHLVTGGPFAWSRNPVYLSLTLAYAGITLLARSLWALLFLPVVLTAIGRGVIAREERYLERRFGDEYRRYRHRVRRWL